MLESGAFNTINELAEREGIAPSYMTQVLRLTLLAPDIVEAILDGKQGPGMTLGAAAGGGGGVREAEIHAVGLNQMGQAAACPNGVDLSPYRGKDHAASSSRNLRLSRNMLIWQVFRRTICTVSPLTLEATRSVGPSIG